MRKRIPYYLSDELSPKERIISNLLSYGKSKNEIASELCLSIGTVNTHVSTIYAKKHINSQRELMIAKIKELEEKFNEFITTTD